MLQDNGDVVHQYLSFILFGRVNPVKILKDSKVWSWFFAIVNP